MGRLVLLLRPGERALIRYPGQPDVWVSVHPAETRRVKIALEGPPEIRFLREELLPEEGDIEDEA
jgi:sRNA-binding carbon storage regulator CsrA